MTTTTMTAAAATEKAGWWTRFLAILIDVIGLGIIGAILTSILTGSAATAQSQGLTLLLQAAYFTYFWSARGKGQTPGMRALNIRVVKTDGTQLDFVGAFVRFIGFCIAIAAFFLGVIWAAFDAQKQGWHDKIASTYVFRA